MAAVRALVGGLLALLSLTTALPSCAQEASDADALAKKLSNPVASLISVPLQFNADVGLGPSDGTKYPGWTLGVLANHIWSFAGDDDRADISSTFLQPFVSKGMAGGRTFTVNLESTYNWETDETTVPVNVSYSRVRRWGSQLVSVSGGARGYVEKAGSRFTITLLYPKN